MAHPEDPATPVVITSDSARGALASDEVSTGATLLPMLIGGLALAVAAMVVIFWLS